MAKYDALDVVLRKIKSKEDWKTLAEICDCKDRINVDDYSIDGCIKTVYDIYKGDIKYYDKTHTYENLAVLFNKEIRTNYGNTFANIFRDEYEPDYDVILKDTAKKLKVKNIPEVQSLSIKDVEYLEKEIMVQVLENVKKSIIKKKGIEAWQNIESMTQDGIEKAYKDGKITAEEYEQMKVSWGSIGMIALLAAGNMSGFLVYMLANQLFFAISRYLGLGIGVAVAGPVIGKTLAFLLGPFGWALATLWLLIGLGDTNWKKTIPTVVCIGAFRQQQKYEARKL